MELTAEQLLQSIWAALRRIETNLALPPAPLELPPINLPAPDLTEIVTAVTSLNGTGPNAEEIAAAIAAVLTPTPNRDPVLEKIVEALEKLDFRAQAQQNFGGGAVSLSPGQTVEIANDAGNPIPVSGTVTMANPTASPETGLAKDVTLTDRLPDLVGTWAYQAGTSGTVNVTGRVIGIAAHATVAGSFTINGGATVPIPANSGIQVTPQANLVSPTLIFTGTDSYFVEALT